MRVTIIRDDGVVGINGYFKTVDLSTLPEGVRAVQWVDSVGHVEYEDGPNTELDSISDFQSFIDAWGEPPVVTPPPAPAVPMVVSRRQGLRALYELGLTAQVEALINAIPGADGDRARIDWKEAQEIRRDHPLVDFAKASIPLTDEQVDQLFTLAASL